jgi:TIR domain
MTSDTSHTTYTWDVFVSHASEDKDTFVTPLARVLAHFSVKVWYDEFTLELGDSLSRSIDRGLAESAFGLVVLSPPFLSKRWPEYELRGLVAREMSAGKTILPIWHGVTRDNILKFSPPLADKLALVTEGKVLLEIVQQVIQVIRPDLNRKVLARVISERASRGETQMMKVADLKIGPPRHAELPAALVGRIRLIRAALLSAYPQTFAYWIDGFRRDLNPDLEVEHWERIASCYLEYVSAVTLSQQQKRTVFEVINGLLTGISVDAMRERIDLLPTEYRDELLEASRTPVPALELAGLPESLEEAAAMGTEAYREMRRLYSIAYRAGSPVARDGTPDREP